MVVATDVRFERRMIEDVIFLSEALSGEDSPLSSSSVVRGSGDTCADGCEDCVVSRMEILCMDLSRVPCCTLRDSSATWIR